MTKEDLYKPLDFREIKAPAYVKRLLFFDPADVYSKITIDPLQRYNKPEFNDLFPEKKDGICDCGCGKKLKASQKRWATPDCLKFAVGVYNIISGATPYIEWLIGFYYGKGCVLCGETPCEADHIIAVNQGGGGSWLRNFQFLCEQHHKEKTAKDNNWTKSKHLKNGK